MSARSLHAHACAFLIALTALSSGIPLAMAQNALNPGANQGQQLNAVPNGGGPGNGNVNVGGGGGNAQADFDSLIDLITSTVDAESWLDAGTGEGQIMPFDINGVYVDADRAVKINGGGQKASLTAIHRQGRRSTTPGTEADKNASQAQSRTPSALRYVSLSRLEAAIARQQRRHEPMDPAVATLAGLQRITHVIVYPETGDLVLAGPAGDWRAGLGSSMVSTEMGRPVVRLDDLLALWRRQRSERSAPFGCSIVPRKEALARTQDFLAASAAEPIEPSNRREWLDDLRGMLGEQDVVYHHLNPETRIARLLLAADFHMKLIGMGLAEGVPGVKSYLATVRLQADGSPPAMSILRWWFAIPEATVETTGERDVFALPKRCVEVLSENELLAAQGERIHTGQSDDLNRQFAASFTAEFPALAAKYPVYGELERVFELAMVLSLIEREGLTERVGWTPTLLLDAKRLRLPPTAAVNAVDTVINHRVIGGRHIIAGVSGGVRVDAGRHMKITETKDSSITKLASVQRPTAAATQTANSDAEAVSSPITWWWD